ncbi:MAG: hypothetical protein ACFFAN_07435 [Promethearchaeota archaeon]
MSKTNKKSNSHDDYEELGFLYRHKVPFNLKFFVKDIEISKKDFLILLFTLNSSVFLLIGQIGLYLMILNGNRIDYYAWASIFNGLLFGMAFSIFIVDRIKKPLIFIKYIFMVSLIITFVQFFLILFKIYQVLSYPLNFLFFINVLLITIALITNCKVYLVKTTILERGRVGAYLFVFLLLTIGIVFSSIFYNLLFLIPVIFVFLAIIYLHFNEESKNLIFPKTAIDQKKKLNIDSIKYNSFFLCFGLTAGLATPYEGSFQFLLDTLGGNLAIIFTIVLIFAIGTSVLIGVIFDYFGRIAPLIYIILAIAIATYINILRIIPDDLPFAVVFSAYISALMCVSLFIGDTETRDNFGKSLSYSYLILGIGIIIGAFLRISLPRLVINESLAEKLIMGTIFMACIACFFLLVYIRETLPYKEQNWKKKLIQIFIIHNSGILLYEHLYIKEKDIRKSQRVSSDLKAGGLIGIKTLLKEIIQGEKEVRTIDHGDRKLIFKFNNSNKVIFALIVKEELIILRKKLDLLIEDFDKNFSQFTDDPKIIGIDMRIFKPIKHLARKHFGK